MADRLDPEFRTKREPHLTVDLLRQGFKKAKEHVPALQGVEDWAERTGAGAATEGALRAATPGEAWEVPLMGLAKAPKIAGAATAMLGGMSEAEAGPLSFLLRGGKTAARTPSLVGRGLDLPGFHWSHQAQLPATNPAMYGTGIKGAEAERLALAPDIRPRSYFYTDELRKEPGLGAHQYTGTLENVYPAGDPEGLMKAARKSNPDDPLTAFERSVKKAGYKGYESGPDKAAVYFEQVNVRPHKQGTMPQPPKPQKARITDTTEVKPGSRTGIVTGPAQDKARMQWLEADKTYEKLGLAPESSTETGFYQNPSTGITERNPVRTESVEYTPGNEQTMDTVNMLRNVMLGQNARAMGGVAPEGGGGLRIAMSGQTPAQKEQLLQALNTEGSYAAPGGADVVNYGLFGGSEGEALEKAQTALQQAGIPHAGAFGGDIRSAYDELDWSKPGQGTITEQQIVPRLLRDPDLVKRLDLTGQPQQLGRGLGAAERKGAMEGDIGRDDVTMLNKIIAQGGLQGLLDLIAKQGAKGLPAVGGAAALPAFLRGPEEQ